MDFIKYRDYLLITYNLGTKQESVNSESKLWIRFKMNWNEFDD